MAFLDPGDPHLLASRVSDGFATTFGAAPDVVGRAPGRVNLIGEHTDYNRGLCLPLALPHATYAACGVREDGRVRVTSRQATEPWTGRVATLGPDTIEGWAAYVAGVVWALREDGLDVPGLDIFIDSTVPLGAGLSSSAAVECAVAVAVASLLDMPLTQQTRHRLVAACVRAESEVAGAPTGGMDQTAALLAAPGGALLVDFAEDTTTPIPLPLAEAGLALLVTDTRVSHTLTDGGYAARRADCEHAASQLGAASLRDVDLADVVRLAPDRLQRRARHVVTEIARVQQAVAAIGASDWTALGALFAASHESLRSDFEVSCPELDQVVDTATRSGALGARMTGAGFGGSAIALVAADRVEVVATAIDLTFAEHGHAPPDHLRAVPGRPADVVV